MSVLGQAWQSNRTISRGKLPGSGHYPAESKDLDKIQKEPVMIDVAIIGAGPYGLSIAAHLKARGVDFRIFGPAMDTWQNHMPKGMRLKSEGFASSIYDPESLLTLGKYCQAKGLAYQDQGLPVPLDTFCSYGL